MESADCPELGGVELLGFTLPVGVRSSYSIRLSMPSAECLRWRLWRISRYSKSAVDGSSRVRHSLRLSSSAWARAQKDSIIALSTRSPMEPIEGSRPQALGR